MPQPQRDEEVYAKEPWFSVGPNDVFPEELPTFLFPQPRWREIFEEEHPDLFTADFWQGIQARVAAGELLVIYPYPASRRFPHPHGTEAPP